jgi:hypothetical protein
MEEKALRKMHSEEKTDKKPSALATTLKALKEKKQSAEKEQKSTAPESTQASPVKKVKEQRSDVKAEAKEEPKLKKIKTKEISMQTTFVEEEQKREKKKKKALLKQQSSIANIEIVATPVFYENTDRASPFAHHTPDDRQAVRKQKTMEDRLKPDPKQYDSLNLDKKARK